MKADVYDLTGAKGKSVNLPSQFNEEVRTDLIRKVVLAIQANSRQPYGARPDAGQRQSGEVSRRRRKYRTSYGHGISRVPRKIMWKRGRQLGWVGAVAPGTVGGRRAHPPQLTKIWEHKINVKERRKAIRSAIAATANAELVKLRGHQFKNLINIIDSKIENLSKTKDVEDLFLKLGLEKELERISNKTIRAGVGKNRGRPYKKKKGPLFVVSGKCNLLRSAKNIPGVDVCVVKDLNAELLAPGATPGRLTIFTEKAIEMLEKEKLFFNKVKA